MTSNNNRSSGGAKGGLGFISALQLAFIVLKLCKVIEWSWIWVLAPTWVSIMLVILVIYVYVKIMT